MKQPMTPFPFSRVTMVLEAARIAQNVEDETERRRLIGLNYRPLIEEVADEIVEDPTMIRSRVAYWDANPETHRFYDEECEKAVRLFAADPTSGAFRRRYVNSQVRSIVKALEAYFAGDRGRIVLHIIESCVEAAIHRDVRSTEHHAWICAYCSQQMPLPGICTNEDCPDEEPETGA